MTTITVIAALTLAMLPGQAGAETRVYVNLGLPALCVDVCGGGYACDGCVWVAGYWRGCGPSCVWVPGHFEPVVTHRVISRPRVNIHEHNTYIYHYGPRHGRYHDDGWKKDGFKRPPAPGYSRSQGYDRGGQRPYGQGVGKATAAANRMW